jgi:hypothetical protein
VPTGGAIIFSLRLPACQGTPRGSSPFRGLAIPTPPSTFITPDAKYRRLRLQFLVAMSKHKDKTFEVACPDCGAMLKIDASTGVLVSHTSAPRKRLFEDLETAAKAMREHGERTESIFRQSVDAEKNKADLLEKRFAEAMRKAKDAPDEKPMREIDLD